MHHDSLLIVASAADAGNIAKLVKARSNIAIHHSTVTRIGQLIKQVQSLAPGMVLIDVELQGLEWASAVYEIKRLDEKPGVVLLANHADRAFVLSAFREGADAYLLKGSVHDELIAALECVSDGRIFYHRADAERIKNHMLYLELGRARHVTEVKDGVARLTVRQKEVFPLLADGKSIKEVAEILGISPKTVETHKYNIMKKLGINKMADFTKLALIKDLIPLDAP